MTVHHYIYKKGLWLPKSITGRQLFQDYLSGLTIITTSGTLQPAYFCMYGWYCQETWLVFCGILWQGPVGKIKGYKNLKYCCRLYVQYSCTFYLNIYLLFVSHYEQIIYFAWY